MKVTDQQVLDAIAASQTMRQACSKLNINFTSFSKRAKKLGAYRPNQGRVGLPRAAGERANASIELDEILKGNHPQYGTAKLKQRLFQANIKEQKCELCGLEKSNAHNVSFVLDHINGINNDHKLTNLRILCPNCNSGTSTFAGRNKKRKNGNKMTDVEIVDGILKGDNTNTILRKMGMACSGVNYKRVDKIRSLVEYIQNQVRVA